MFCTDCECTCLLVLALWFVVDEYYCSETTTTQVCLGYVSLDHPEQPSVDERQPAPNSCPLFALFALRTLFSMYVICMDMYTLRYHHPTGNSAS